MEHELHVVSHPAAEFVNKHSGTNVPVIKGVNYRRQEKINASSKNDKTCTFSVSPPQNTSVDKCIIVKMSIKVSGTNAELAKLSLRDYPLSRMVQNANLTINGTTFSAPVKALSELTLRTNNDYDKRRMTSLSPNMIDEFRDVGKSKTHLQWDSSTSKNFGLTNGSLENHGGVNQQEPNNAIPSQQQPSNQQREAKQ